MAVFIREVIVYTASFEGWDYVKKSRSDYVKAKSLKKLKKRCQEYEVKNTSRGYPIDFGMYDNVSTVVWGDTHKCKKIDYFLKE